MKKEFEESVVVVTGASSGIGLATAQLLEARGAKVALFARNLGDLERAAATMNHALVVAGDVQRACDQARLFEEVRQRWGKVDGLFINAGCAEFLNFEAADEAHFDRQLDTNLKGAYLSFRAALPHLSESASIVVNTSVSALVGSPCASAYAASKAGLWGLAQNLAAELLPRRVNAVAPGPTATPIQTKHPMSEADLAKMAPYVMARMRMGRLAEAREVAEVVCFLLSERASFVHGQQIAVDGGLSGL